MKLSEVALDGLRCWGLAVHSDELMFDANASSPEFWAWVWFQLRVTDDQPEWFPRGKSATLQHIEEQLLREARNA